MLKDACQRPRPMIFRLFLNARTAAAVVAIILSIPAKDRGISFAFSEYVGCNSIFSRYMRPILIRLPAHGRRIDEISDLHINSRRIWRGLLKAARLPGVMDCYLLSTPVRGGKTRGRWITKSANSRLARRGYCAHAIVRFTTVKATQRKPLTLRTGVTLLHPRNPLCTKHLLLTIRYIPT